METACAYVPIYMPIYVRLCSPEARVGTVAWARRFAETGIEALGNPNTPKSDPKSESGGWGYQNHVLNAKSPNLYLQQTSALFLA